MITEKGKKILLVLIIIFAFILRFWKITDYPAGFSLDEISQGYTAYSILKTGKDEWGVFLPLAPRAFGDFRSPLYTYLTIPTVAIFGLNNFSVRLPSAIIGVMAVLAVYWLVKEIGGELLALISSFFLAISPWHFSLSRGAFEASLNTFLLPLGMFLFLKGLKKWPYLLVSGFVFGVNLFSYYSPRFFTPLTVIVLIIYFKRDFFRQKKNKYFLLIFAFFFFLAILTFFTGGKTRVADTSILNPTDRWQVLSERQYEASFFGAPVQFERIFNNKVIFVVNQFVKNYFEYFSFEFLFTRGASEATYGMIPGRGVLYWFELPLLIFMAVNIFKENKRHFKLIVILLLLSPIAAALAKGERAANRSSTMLPFWQILSAAGAVELFKWTKGKFTNYYKYFLVFYSLTILIFFAFFLEDYFYHSQKYNAFSMAYGWEEAMEFIKKIENKYDRIIVSKRFSEPQAGVAFYKGWEPVDFQKNAQEWLVYEKMGYLFVDQMPQYKLGKYLFKKINFPEDLVAGNTLVVGTDEDFWGVNDGKILKIVYYPGPDKKVAFKIVKF